MLGGYRVQEFRPLFLVLDDSFDANIQSISLKKLAKSFALNYEDEIIDTSARYWFLALLAMM